MKNPLDIPGVHKVANGELFRQGSCETLGILHQIVMQESRISVEQFHLLHCCLGHLWMAVPH